MDRTEEKILEQLTDQLGVNICIDGPTGTGKSSLALTVLKRKKINFLLIQITTNMTWKDFCLNLLRAKKNENSTLKTSIDAGLDKGLPVFKVHFGITSNDNSLENLELEEKTVASFTDHKICEIMKEENITLLIDDFERASDEILTNIGEMCKLLTESYVNKNARLIIVGTDDIFRRLINFNKSLENRLKEISLGTIANRQQSWRFLTQGFDKLNISHIEKEFKKGYATKEDLGICKQYCYEAANGLLKSLNELGLEIALKGENRTRISKADIVNTCKKYPPNNVKRFVNIFPKLAAVINNNDIVKEVLLYLYQEGIGQIHNWDSISNHFYNVYEFEQVENAICELVDADFLTRTGYNGEVLFVTNPTLAHTLAVVMTYPDKYRAPNSLKNNEGQLVIPFKNKNNH
ncbi:hypothetical protein PbJCM13498_04860 [Prolixibacter bellariivorans]|uniref:ORC1/DEAH AAA+ ATPase domain-containing protein n=2 Tax=Prolixibacter bellariivorans TaxID=314319 RepID=A0A5M4AVD0_9BACT|nr:hypothetical protein PbJCM13498_04860 [Prolixibacter bellariivorans]